MKLTPLCRRILDAAQSGSLENAAQPLAELNALLGTNPHNCTSVHNSPCTTVHNGACTSVHKEDVASALRVLALARTNAYAHRAHIAQSLQSLDRSSLYSLASTVRSTFHLAG